MVSEPLLVVEGLTKDFTLRSWGTVRAVDHVSFSLAASSTLALVGESGCGKTTTGRMVLRLIEPSGGKITFDGANLTALTAAQVRPYRRQLQAVFQDSNGAFDPRQTIGHAIEEPLLVQGVPSRERRARSQQAMKDCELEPALAQHYPHQLSGGQRQRAAIARAIVLRPKLIVADEPVSALDASIQSQLLNLLLRLQTSYGISYLFISHDLAVVAHIADYVGVMYLGQLVEYGPAEQVLAFPAHPYTRALLEATPQPRPGGPIPRGLPGLPPSPFDLQPGCSFASRCPLASPRCFAERPPDFLLQAGQRSRCWLNEDRARAVGGQA